MRRRALDLLEGLLDLGKPLALAPEQFGGVFCAEVPGGGQDAGAFDLIDGPSYCAELVSLG